MGTTTGPRGYEEMLKAAGTLIGRQKKPADLKPHQSAPLSTLEYLRRLGISDDVQKLSVIHVAGTKGKGSTCCFTESILRHSGCRTGLYTSPHLLDIRERIRLDGIPVSEDMYLDHFWWTFDTLKAAATEDVGMPFFFEFMTLLALRIFIEEKVDVAILEVGIGGRKDATNIMERPTACGIAALGYDHMEILGDTLPQIAWQKAGIMKAGVPTVTCPQVECALDTLKQNAAEVGCELRVAEPLEQYTCPAGEQLRLGLAGDHQRENAAVALQLAMLWMQRALIRPELAEQLEPIKDGLKAMHIPAALMTALASASWPGRAQVLHDTQALLYGPATDGAFSGNSTLLAYPLHAQQLGMNSIRDGSPPSDGGVTFYLDGAHTQESVAQCAKWFASTASKAASKSGGTEDCEEPSCNIMLFYTMPKRDAREILTPLHRTLLQKNCSIDHALFIPLDSNVNALSSSATKPEVDLAWEKMGEVWEALRAGAELESAGLDSHLGNETSATGSICVPVPPDSVTIPPRPPLQQSRSTAVRSLGKAVDSIRMLSRQQPNLRVKVLVTGSLYLVGDVMKMLKDGPN